MSEQTALPLGEAPNEFVAEKATQIDLFPMEKVALLGVAGPDDNMRAMIRLPDGSILQAGLGADTRFGTLIEVSPAGVVIELANGNATFLAPHTPALTN